MNQIAIEKISKSFGEKQVLKDVNIYAGYGEKIGIVGENGCGKSTLFKIIAGEMSADRGSVRFSKGTSVALLNQDGYVNHDGTESFELEKHLNILGSEKTNGEMSGGEKTKLALSKIFSKNVGLLLLDEPTNNLDFDGINSLLSLLNGFDGTIITISHDRYFLDQLVDRVVEIEDGKSVEYNGNYTYYRQQKQKLFEESLHRYESDKKEQKKLQGAIDRVKDWAEKGHRESTDPDPSGLKHGIKEKNRKKVKKMDSQVKNNIKRLEAMREKGEERPKDETNIYFQINGGGKQGKSAIQAEGISKSFGDKLLFEGSDFFINYGEKIAVFGPNGCGKSTLIDMIIGKVNPDSGELWVSSSCMLFIMKQDFVDLPKNKSILQFFIEKFGKLDGNDRKLLHNMGLTSRLINQKIETLSFGEQMKAKMAESIIDNQDFLILDEPQIT